MDIVIVKRPYCGNLMKFLSSNPGFASRCSDWEHDLKKLGKSRGRAATRRGKA